jgi:hypothetical protein
MRELITLTTFFRQHALTYYCIDGDTRQTDLKRITLCARGCTVGTFRNGHPDHSSVKLFVVLTTLLGNHPCPFIGIVGNSRQT